jgi:YbgC/YbaW family acyl-CoA thioester hydrolase
MYELITRRKVEFSDTDMAGIVHFSRLIVFMENAEHAFFEALGASVSMEHEGKHIGWPRVAVEAEFKAPARFNEHVDIHVQVLKKGTSSMTYGFEIRVGERIVGTGKMTSVCCEMTPKGPRPMPIPAFLADQIEEAPPGTAWVES